MLEPRTGRLLVASPLLEDPNFARTVVLICAHGDEGTLGLVLNRPLEASVVDHVAVWSEFCSPPARIFVGGPVAPSTVLGLARAEPNALGTAFEGDLGLIDLEAAPGTLAGRLQRLRLYAGHSGWGAGQLAAELAQEAWFVVDAAPSDVFSDEPATLWREVLRRQRGDVQLLAFYPRDPDLN